MNWWKWLFQDCTCLLLKPANCLDLRFCMQAWRFEKHTTCDIWSRLLWVQCFYKNVFTTPFTPEKKKRCFNELSSMAQFTTDCGESRWSRPDANGGGKNNVKQPRRLPPSHFKKPAMSKSPFSPRWSQIMFHQFYRQAEKWLSNQAHCVLRSPDQAELAIDVSDT